MPAAIAAHFPPAALVTLETGVEAPPLIPLARRERILARRAVFDSEYWKIIAQCARRAPAVATEVEYLREHDKAWNARLALVNGANESIVCSTYCIEPDAFGLAYVDALIAAKKRGVAVALVIDTLAQKFVMKGAQADALAMKLKELEASGATVRRFGGLEQQSRLLASGNHAKMLVVDGMHAIAGGRNVGGNYYGHLFRDFEMRMTGPVALQMQADFMTILGRTDYEKGPGTFSLPARPGEKGPGKIAGLYHVVTWDPLHDGGEIMREKNRITQALLMTFLRARREITLTSNYVVGHPELRQALIDAAQLGVKVRIITTGESASHISKMAYRATTPGYDELVAAGVEIYETQDTPDHAKIFVVDDVAAFGSYNLSDYADGRLSETLIFTAAANDVAKMRAILEESIAKGSTRYVPGAEPKLSFGERFKRWIGSLVYTVRSA
ncbi:MAG: phosphatidylserine/phosphatidylglycerophosphate/cardiolipin synthase family protein [Deltaproteobacteria bacterium]|nr:phosphatidylserine/phosphatidylglycerophosphate/cardiolipin synthase family protein [Deltaproteobacteria bacterium]